jgi:NitT/TauT family transport system ATP-binding protein
MSSLNSATAQLADLIPICTRLPLSNVDQLVGATKVLANADGRMSHREFALALAFGDEHMAGVTEFLVSLDLIEVIGMEVALTAVGKRIARAGINMRRRLFSELALRLPIVRKVVDTLASRPNRSLQRGKLLDDLGASSCAGDAGRLFDHLVAWGRYAGLFSYEASSGMVSLI